MGFKQIKIRFWIYAKLQNTANKYKQHISVKALKADQIIDSNGYVTITAKEAERTLKASHLIIKTDGDDFYGWSPLEAIADPEKINSGIIKTSNDDKVKRAKKGERV